MDFGSYYESPGMREVEALEVASEMAGLDRLQMMALLDTDLEINYLIEYLEAVLADQMN